VTPSAISQVVRALEARVGAAFFIRTTRSVGLTEAGERFLLRAKPAFEELVAASEAAGDLGKRPARLLRLSVRRSVVPLILEPVIAAFCQAYPEIEVEIAASDEMVDVAASGFGAGIRLGQFVASDMVAVRLTPRFMFVVVGSRMPAVRDMADRSFLSVFGPGKCNSKKRTGRCLDEQQTEPTGLFDVCYRGCCGRAFGIHIPRSNGI